jgi:hypothetical protein
MDPKHRFHWVVRQTTLAAGSGAERLDQINQRFSRHYRLHLSHEDLALGVLFSR